jgi:hypothetical protein
MPVAPAALSPSETNAARLASTSAITRAGPHAAVGCPPTVAFGVAAPSVAACSAVEVSVEAGGATVSVPPGSSSPRSDPERRILRGHHRRICDRAQHPTVQTEREVEDRPRVLPTEQEHDDGDQHEQPDQPDPRHASPGVISGRPYGRAATADKHTGDHILRDARQPPADQRESRALVLRVVDLQASWILRCVVGVNGG